VAIVNRRAVKDLGRSSTPDEPRYLGKILSYWLKTIRYRDEQTLSLAFDAIRGLGPDAWPAAPELTRIVAAPFSPIRIGKDTEEQIADKLYDIEVRAEAIDALASIGESAATATMPVIRWALTERVIPAVKTTKIAGHRKTETGRSHTFRGCPSYRCRSVEIQQL
jgi:hypothetical protein